MMPKIVPMRTKLGRVAALVVVGLSAVAAGPTLDVAVAVGTETTAATEALPTTETATTEPDTEPAGAAPSTAPATSDVPPPSTEPVSTTPASGEPGAGPDAASTTSSTSSTSVAPPLVVEVPAAITPSRGTQRQVGDTVPVAAKPDDWLPDNSGEGRRIVYSKTKQRVWLVEADGSVVKTHRVSGRLTWNQPSPGTYSVFSRSSFTCNIKNPAICWRYMVRFTKGPEGDNIGFHEIPRRDGVPVQSESQLGTALSGGCVRQATADAVFVWNWAPVGTKVVVLA
jgi:lipoprotein-anchoring transpeptidase ErfK/SrfK